MTGQRRGGGAPRERRGEDVVHKLKCTLAEMYKGGTRKLAMNRKTTCGPCSGPGTKHGQKITLRGEAGVQQPGVLPGDLVFVLAQQEHAQFQRKATDLLFEKEITLAEALCGFTYTIDHLDGRQLVVSSPGGGEIVRPDDWVCVP